MDATVIIGFLMVFLALASLGVVFYYYYYIPKKEANIRALMTSTQTRTSSFASSVFGGKKGTISEENRQHGILDEEELQRLKEEARKELAKKKGASLEDLFFQAGMFSPQEQRQFRMMRVILPFILTPLGMFLGYTYGGSTMLLLAGIISLLIALQIPRSILDRKIEARHEDIMYYLPLVIEQIVIGVSSSLDIGPCIQRIVNMADERDTHNVVTELLKIVQSYIKSGISLEQALVEVGKKTGHTELKHAFMSLSQVAKHGGEVTRQLQELADAVGNQRETKIEAKIKKLELAATGPVALVFLGFMIILLIGFGLQLKGAFG